MGHKIPQIAAVATRDPFFSPMFWCPFPLTFPPTTSTLTFLLRSSDEGTDPKLKTLSSWSLWRQKNQMVFVQTAVFWRFEMLMLVIFVWFLEAKKAYPQVIFFTFITKRPAWTSLPYVAKIVGFKNPPPLFAQHVAMYSLKLTDIDSEKWLGEAFPFGFRPIFSRFREGDLHVNTFPCHLLKPFQRVRTDGYFMC